MTEEEAQAWLATRFGGGAVAKVETFLQMVTDENQRQNLLSPASVPSIWSRHVVDSAQLLDHLPTHAVERWVDIGTGGGFPGIIVALLIGSEVVMVEPRRKRAVFLNECVDRLGLGRRAMVIVDKVERVSCRADVISARAVSSVENVLRASAHCATSGSRWILPRGRSLEEDLTVMANRFGVMFHVEQSITDPGSVILVADKQ